METNRKNRLGLDIWKSVDWMWCNWFEKGWCCSKSIGQGSRRGIQETSWNVWGEHINIDSILYSFSFAATNSWSGEEHRDLLPIRGGQDKVILDGKSQSDPKRGQIKSDLFWGSKTRWSLVFIRITNPNCSQLRRKVITSFSPIFIVNWWKYIGFQISFIW